MEEKIKKRLSALADRYGLDFEQLEKDFLGLIEEGYSEHGALVALKSRYKYLEGSLSGKIIMYPVRIFEPRSVELNSGETAENVSIAGLFVVGDTVFASQLTLWDEKIAMVENIEELKPYEFEGRYHPGKNRVYLGREKTISEAEDARPLGELLIEIFSDMDSYSFPELSDLIGQRVLIGGYIGRVSKQEDFTVLEIGTLDDDPVAVFVWEDDEIPDGIEGKAKAAVLGRVVKNNNDEITISADYVKIIQS